MGYSTYFDGRFELDKALTPARIKYLQQFAHTRRFKRDEEITAGRPDPIRKAVKLPVGIEGGYFVGAEGDFGQEGMGYYGADEDKARLGVVNDNYPPKGQPGLWCQWVPTEDGKHIEHDGGEKFCDYVEWLRYLVEHFIEPWGYKLNGQVKWNGEDSEDMGLIVCKNNKITVKQAVITFE